MSEEQTITETAPQEAAKPKPPVRKGLSPAGVLFAMIVGAAIGAGAYYAIDERRDQQLVADVTSYFGGTLQDTGPQMDGVLKSMEGLNYGEARSGLEEILTVWRKANQVKGMEEEWTMMDDLIAGLDIAVEKVGAMSEDALPAVEKVAGMMKQMGIDVDVQVDATMPAPPAPPAPVPGTAATPPAPQAAPAPQPPASPPPPAPGR